MKLYDSPVSGNAYKVRLLLAHLGLAYERVEIDVMQRAGRPERLGDKTPILKIPLLELDDGRHLAESNAILWYLARGTPYLSQNPFVQARTLQWMFFEQNNVEPNLAVARVWVTLRGEADQRREALAALHEAGGGALAAMERHLGAQPFFGADFSIADISLFAYTHVAHEGGFTLDPYPAIRDWLARVAARPGHVSMAGKPGGAGER